MTKKNIQSSDQSLFLDFDPWDVMSKKAYIKLPFKNLKR